MTKPNRKTPPARPKTGTPRPRPSAAERMLARSALLARRILDLEAGDEPLLAPAAGRPAGSAMVH
ncbi:MAG: hypothetical protein ACWA6X_03060 [Bauldia sp.]|jgi:hypothetical protein